MEKRVLVISNRFFPDPSVGAVRMTQWCRFLPEFGWRPTVLCRHYGHTATRELLAEHVHPDVVVRYFNPPVASGTPVEAKQRVEGTPGYRRFLHRLGLTRWIVPDPTIRTWQRAVPKARQEAEQLKPHVILTTSPRHATHAVGLTLSRELDIPWVADFRDPYLIDSRFQPRGMARLRLDAHRRFERAIYEQAALTTHAIPVHARWARRAYPFARSRIESLTNGYPPELEAALQEPIQSPEGLRSLRVIGFPSDAVALQLARAIDHLIRGGTNVELRFVGRRPTTYCQIEHMLGSRVHLTGRLTSSEALRQLAGADVLICPLDLAWSAHLGLSSKLFEYLAAGKPMVVINPTWSNRHLLRGLRGIEILVDPPVAELCNALRRALDPQAVPPAEQVAWARRTFNRRDQVRQLAAWLDRLIT